jgi:uncharacterized membrane protein
MHGNWTLRRNCCLTPLQLAVGLGAPCGLALAIGLWYKAQGAWPVLAFAVLQSCVAALLFLHHAAHASDHEQIKLRETYLQIDLVMGGQCQRTLFDPRFTRISAPAPGRPWIEVASKGRVVTIGRYLAAHERTRFARQLQHAITHPYR